MFKKILLAVLAVIVMGGSSVAFSWWDQLSLTKNENNIITIGQGLEIVVEDVVINPATAGTLIPASAVLKAGDTYAIELTYIVKFNATLQEELNLEVTVSNILVNGVENPFDLIAIAVANPGVIQNADVTITLTVTIDDSDLDEADFVAAYLAVANQTITFTVAFAATRQG